MISNANDVEIIKTQDTESNISKSPDDLVDNKDGHLPEDMLVLDNVSHYYNTKAALKNVTLRVKKNEIFAFIGPNGAGKTTAIRILSTLLKPTRGSAFVAGVPVDSDPDYVHSLIGYMPDSFGVYDGMLVGEYLDFFAAAFKIPKNKRKAAIDYVLELTTLENLRNTNTDHLSKGMRQRLCLAKTMLHDPQVLILDEPNSGLDPRARIETRKLFQKLNSMGKTIFISSHILPELAEYCTSVGIIEAGCLLASGSVESIMKCLNTGRLFSIKVLKESQQAIHIIEKIPGVSKVSLENDTIVFGFDGSLEDVSLMMQKLSQEKVAFYELKELKVDLQDVFMNITKGVVA